MVLAFYSKILNKHGTISDDIMIIIHFYHENWTTICFCFFSIQIAFSILQTNHSGSHKVL